MWKARNKKSSPVRLVKISLLVVFMLITISVFALIRSNLFIIKAVEIATKDISCVEENQLKDASGLLGQSFFLVNFKNIGKKLKDKFFCIRDINLTYIFPGKIKIEASGRQPVATLILLKNKEATASSFLENVATSSAGESLDAYLIDNEGMVFLRTDGGSAIPKIFLYDLSLSPGKKAEGNIENSLKILYQVKTFGLDVKTATVLDNFFIIFSYPKVIFQLDDKIDAQIASLQLILAEAKIDSSKLEFIDLRFDKPVVRFAPKESHGER